MTYAEFVRQYIPDASYEMVCKILHDCDISIWIPISDKEMRKRILSWKSKQSQEVK